MEAREKEKDMESLELFAGYGGLGLATERVFGVKTAMVAEWEDSLSPVLEARFPDAPNLRDVTAIDWPSLSLPHLKLMGGGSPCQDVSHAGPRRGMHADTRSGLWSAMRAGIATLRPEWVVWENVRGALSSPATSRTPELEDPAAAKKAPRLRALGRVLGDLVELGYDVQWRGVKASDVGAPHQRFRVFVLARRQDAGAPVTPRGAAFAWWNDDLDLWDESGVTFDGPTVFTKSFPTDGFVVQGIAYSLPKWSTQARPATPPTPRTTDGKGAGRHGSGGPDLRTVVSTLSTPRSTDGAKGGPGQVNGRGIPDSLPAIAKLLPTPTASRVNDGENVAGWDARRARIKAQGINGNGMGEPLTVAAQRLVEDLLPTPTVGNATGGNARRGGARGNELLLPGAAVEHATDWGKYAPAIARWEAVLGRSAPAPTETGTKGAQRLSPAFVEWMMGLPSGWVTDPALGLSRAAQLKALGNGVLPLQAEAALVDMRARFDAQH